MQKRGQVSVFVIVGIVIILAMVLIFMLIRSAQEKAKETRNPRQYLQTQLEDIKKIANKCITDETSEALKDLYDGGGHLNPVRYSDYYGKKVTFLCYKVDETVPCYNMMFTKNDINEELKPKLENGISSCMNSGLTAFRNQDYELETGEFSLDFVFEEEALLVTVNYPITLTRATVSEKEDTFKKEIITNFWKAAELASNILELESSGQEVNIPSLSSSNVYFEISRKNVLGGDLYILHSRSTDDPTFYFAVER